MKLPAPPAPGEKFRILVVEDDQMVAQMLVLHLTSAGFAAFFAADGKAGLERFQTLDPHLVITDLVMPEMTGQELCAAIRRESAVPILVMTAFDSDENALTSLRLGADDHFPKTANTNLMLARVKANLRRVYRYPAEVEPA